MKSFKFLLVSLFFLLAISSCDIEDPAEPTWNVKGTVPLINSTYSALSLINENDSVAIADANDIVAYVYEDVFETIEVGDSLSLNDTSSTLEFEVGKHIALPVFQDTSYQTLESISQQTGAALTEGSTNIDAAITGVQSNDYFLSIGNSIRYVHVDEGSVEFTLINNTGIDFTELTLDLKNGKSFSQLAKLDTLIFDNVPAGKTLTRSLKLSGKILYPYLSAKIKDGIIPAQHDVVVRLSDSLNVVVQRSDPFSFTETLAKIPEQHTTDEDSISITGDRVISLEKAKLKAGQIKISVKNGLPSAILENIRAATITFHDVVQSNGSALRVKVGNPQSPMVEEYSDLTNTTLQPSDRHQSNTMTHSKYSLDLTIGAIDDYVLITSTDIVTATVTSSDLISSYFLGTTQAIDYEISTDPLQIDAFEDLGENPQAKFYNPRLIAEFQSSVGFPISGKPTFIGKTEQSTHSLTPLPVNIPKTSVGMIQFDSSNSNISEFLEFFPTEVEASGKMTFNPNAEKGEAYDSSKARVKLKVILPTVFDVTKIMFDDTSDVDITDTEDIAAFSVTLSAISELPLNASFYVTFFDAENQPLKLENGRDFRLPRNDSIQINMPPLITSSINSNFLESGGSIETKNLIDLTSEEIRLLEQAKYAATFITADTKEEDELRQVILKTTDKLHIKAFGSATYSVNKDE